MLWLLAAVALGPESDHKYSFGSKPHRGSRGHSHADWSWFTGSGSRGRSHRGGSLLSGSVSWW